MKKNKPKSENPATRLLRNKAGAAYSPSGTMILMVIMIIISCCTGKFILSLNNKIESEVQKTMAYKMDDYKRTYDELLKECQGLYESIDMYKKSLDLATQEAKFQREEKNRAIIELNSALDDAKFWKKAAKLAQEDEKNFSKYADDMRASIEELVYHLNDVAQDPDLRIKSVTFDGDTIRTKVEDASNYYGMEE